MKTIILQDTTESIEAVLDGAVAANQPEFVAAYADSTAAALDELSSNGVLNSTTDVELVAAPAASTKRVVKEISIYNKDTASVTLTVKFVDGANERIIWSGVVGTGITWTLSGSEANNISDANATDLTDSGDTTLHYHTTDRNRANHAGVDNIDMIPGSDHSATGNVSDSINAGETIAAFESVYLKSDGEWWQTDADDLTKVEGMLAIALESGTDGNALNVALPGSYIRDDSWTWTIGSPIYISATAGALTQTKPDSDGGEFVREVGYAVTADVMRFEPKEMEKLYALLAISGNQTTDVDADDHIEFDTVVGNLVLSTGAGQADGLITLKAGRTYHLQAMLHGVFVNDTGEVWFKWYDTDNVTYVGIYGVIYSVTKAINNSEANLTSAIIPPPAADIEVEVRFFSETALSLVAASSRAYIKEI